MTRRFLLLFLASLSFIHAQPGEKPYVVLVSIDGFRYDYADRYKTKNIQAVRDEGAGAESMIPSFPSVTFPNHISIVTGMYPEHHGIVGNSFYDPARGAQYTMRSNSTDGSWIDARATPLWVLAEQQHLLSACMFWPTCDGEIHGVRPAYWKLYDGNFPNEKRVQQVIDWLKLPAEKRPHFITLYFSDVDHAGHTFGPEAIETAEAAKVVDSMIGKLREGLDALKLPVNLIIVSDHGMQDVTYGAVDLEGEVGAHVRVELDGPVALFYCKDAETIEKTYAKLKKNSKLDVYRRAETPAWWHYNENPRSGDLVAIVKNAAVFELQATGARGRPRTPPRGEHGYDPREFKTMHAIFYAIGPNIRPKTRIGAFENVNVYPFIAKILGLTPGKLDGSFSMLEPLYVP
jgi:predicted AlkP superfamily pyrophosphatase or phosphodiesterase